MSTHAKRPKINPLKNGRAWVLDHQLSSQAASGRLAITRVLTEDEVKLIEFHARVYPDCDWTALELLERIDESIRYGRRYHGGCTPKDTALEFALREFSDRDWSEAEWKELVALCRKRVTLVARLDKAKRTTRTHAVSA